ncbi:hypothetical protein C8R45DRAFT_1097296 [Mycena sanguinolenta]|nr:hypothetical protein C8R45DRAFT_1097296 [Mycena sanguinolenta]
MEEPKIGSACVVCFDSTSLMRCSMCKNRFYCSAKCQKRDWRQHKWNCSVLPVDGLPAATVIEINDEFNEAVKHVSPAMLAPLLRFPDELPSHLQYARAIKHSATFKYRLPLITITRLFLVSYVIALAPAPAQRAKYLDWFVQCFPSVDTPPDWSEMHGPKIVGRPADLSPGEYMVLAKSMGFCLMSEVEKALADNGGLLDGDGGGERHTTEVDVAQDRDAGRVSLLRPMMVNVSTGRVFGIP